MRPVKIGARAENIRDERNNGRREKGERGRMRVAKGM